MCPEARLARSAALRWAGQSEDVSARKGTPGQDPARLDPIVKSKDLTPFIYLLVAQGLGRGKPRRLPRRPYPEHHPGHAADGADKGAPERRQHGARRPRALRAPRRLI